MVTEMVLSSRQFDTLRELIYRHLGLSYEDSKLDFLEKRVQRRMTELSVQAVDDYLFQLRFLDAGGVEMQALANLITTNETYMFREFDQLQAFADHCLPLVLTSKERASSRRLRLWSAGCSSGEEAYTLAIILREIMHDVDEWDIRVVATDVDEVRLAMAGRAIYGPYAVRDVPVEYAGRHLLPAGKDTFKVHPDTARLVDVSHLNLHDHEAMRAMRDFDFIFCRNVLIYFDDASRKSVVDHFYGALSAGGFLYLGHAESVSRITNAFKLRRLGPHLVYSKGE